MPKSQRKSQTVVPGLGQHYTSPKKAAPRRATFVRPLGHEIKKQRLTDELNKLLGLCEPGGPGPATLTAPEPHIDVSQSDTDVPMDNFAAMDIGTWLYFMCGSPSKTCYQDPPAPSTLPPPSAKAQGDSGSDTAVLKLYTAWASLLPTLVDPILKYERQSISKPLIPPSKILRDCESIPGQCKFKTFKILCLFHDRRSCSVHFLICRAYRALPH